MGRLLRTRQPTGHRGGRNKCWIFEPCALRHCRRHKLQQLFSRHHHRQQHRQQHAGIVLRDQRLRPRHRPRHAKRHESDQFPRAVAMFSDLASRPERDQRREPRVQRHRRWTAAVQLPMAFERHQPARRRQRLRHRQQRFSHHLGHNQQQRQLSNHRHQQLRFRDQQRCRFVRWLRARPFRAACQFDHFVRQQRIIQRDGGRLGSARLSMAQKRNEPCQRRGNFRRDQQRSHAQCRHDEQQRQLQCVRHK